MGAHTQGLPLFSHVDAGIYEWLVAEILHTDASETAVHVVMTRDGSRARKGARGARDRFHTPCLTTAKARTGAWQSNTVVLRWPSCGPTIESWTKRIAARAQAVLPETVS